jgi:hypothetical protein
MVPLVWTGASTGGAEAIRAGGGVRRRGLLHVRGSGHGAARFDRRHAGVGGNALGGGGLADGPPGARVRRRAGPAGFLPLEPRGAARTPAEPGAGADDRTADDGAGDEHGPRPPTVAASFEPHIAIPPIVFGDRRRGPAAAFQSVTRRRAPCDRIRGSRSFCRERSRSEDARRLRARRRPPSRRAVGTAPPAAPCPLDRREPRPGPMPVPASRGRGGPRPSGSAALLLPRKQVTGEAEGADA